jgi:hypothetical protein
MDRAEGVESLMGGVWRSGNGEKTTWEVSGGLRDGSFHGFLAAMDRPGDACYAGV